MTKPYDIAVFAARNRNRVYEVVIKALEKAAEEKHINRKAIAQAIGKSPSQVSTTLSGPSNWTLDTVSDLLRAVGAEMNYSVIFDEDQVKSNIFHPAAPTPPPALAQKANTSTTSPQAKLASLTLS